MAIAFDQDSSIMSHGCIAPMMMFVHLREILRNERKSAGVIVSWTSSCDWIQKSWIKFEVWCHCECQLSLRCQCAGVSWASNAANTTVTLSSPYQILQTCKAFKIERFQLNQIKSYKRTLYLRVQMGSSPLNPLLRGRIVGLTRLMSNEHWAVGQVCLWFFCLCFWYLCFGYLYFWYLCL